MLSQSLTYLKATTLVSEGPLAVSWQTAFGLRIRYLHTTSSFAAVEPHILPEALEIHVGIEIYGAC